MNLDDRIERAIDAVVQQVRAALESELRAVADHAVAASTEEREAAIAEAQQSKTAETEAAVREALEAARSEREAAIAEAQQSKTAEIEAAVREAREAARSEHEEALREAFSVAARDRDQAAQQARSAAEAEAGAAQAEAERQFASLLADEASKLAATEAEVARLTEALASAQALAEYPRAENVAEAVTEAHVRERQADLACAARLLGVTRKMDQASSLTEILDSLADYAHTEVGRAALFLVHGKRLHGWRILGFENVPEDGHGVQLDVDSAGVIARAVRTGEPAATSDHPGHADEPGAGEELPAFVALTAGRAGLAMPVYVGHQVVAAIYADEGTGDPMCTPSAWPEIIEVAARHAGRCLELMTAAKAASVRSDSSGEAGTPRRVADAMPARSGMSHLALGGEDAAVAEEEAARRYARLLVSEIRLYNEAAVIEGRQAGNVAARLRPEIERAHRLFQEKFPMRVGTRLDCFEEELVRTLADGDASLLGKVT